LANQLQNALSPYLLQHQDNPVHWYPWSDKAFKKAKQEDKPIFLSIGYAACHWCHVMAHESFVDVEIANYLNDYFISIKVDREEHPEVDKIYMDAVVRLIGHGGWPLSVFLTSAGKPFFGGTYFPNKPRYGQPGFLDVLKQVELAWQQQKQDILNSADEIALTLHKKIVASENKKTLATHDIVHFKNEYTLDFDKQYGGLHGAPKFPQIPMWNCLFAIGCDTQDDDIVQQCFLTADHLCLGGIYDHVGGGWMRYSTDDEWLAPHFEKMLYDNALIISYLSDLNQYEPTLYYKNYVSKTIAWLQREMLLDEGVYAASLNADSEGVEGKFYIWDEAEVATITPEKLVQFKQCFDVTRSGNWEGSNILRIKNRADLSHDFDDELQQLLAMRNKRIRPSRDDKCVTEWNALLITALVKASFSFSVPAWFDHAKQLYHALETLLYRDGHWVHCYRGGKYSDNVLLDDQANIVTAQLMLYLYSGDTDYLEKAMQLMTTIETLFLDNDNHLFNMTPSQDCAYITNPQALQDNATAAGNGVMAVNYAMLYHITGRNEYRITLENIFCVTSSIISSRYNIYHGSLTHAWLLLHDGGKLTIKQNSFKNINIRFRSNLYLRQNTQDNVAQVCQGNVCKKL